MWRDLLVLTFQKKLLPAYFYFKYRDSIFPRNVGTRILFLSVIKKNIIVREMSVV